MCCLSILPEEGETKHFTRGWSDWQYEDKHNYNKLRVLQGVVDFEKLIKSCLKWFLNKRRLSKSAQTDNNAKLLSTFLILWMLRKTRLHTGKLKVRMQGCCGGVNVCIALNVMKNGGLCRRVCRSINYNGRRCTGELQNKGTQQRLVSTSTCMLTPAARVSGCVFSIFILFIVFYLFIAMTMLLCVGSRSSQPLGYYQMLLLVILTCLRKLGH